MGEDAGEELGDQGMHGSDGGVMGWAKVGRMTLIARQEDLEERVKLIDSWMFVSDRV